MANIQDIQRAQATARRARSTLDKFNRYAANPATKRDLELCLKGVEALGTCLEAQANYQTLLLEGIFNKTVLGL